MGNVICVACCSVLLHFAFVERHIHPHAQGTAAGGIVHVSMHLLGKAKMIQHNDSDTSCMRALRAP